MVSAAVETDARLQGLARGADDYLGKPFSPKELIARIKRQLARAADARDVRRRGQEAERELSHARAETQRTHGELAREQRLRGLALGAGRRLHDALDRGTLAARLLALARAQLDVGTVALLALEEPGGPLAPVAVTGEGFERTAGLALRSEGELATLLAGLGRPVRRQDLEAFPELQPELPPLVASGFTLLAPIRGAEGLEAVLLADDRRDGRELERADFDALSAVCEVAAPAFLNARRCRAHAAAILDGWTALADAASTEAERLASTEAETLTRAAARARLVPEHEADLVARTVRLGRWIAVGARGALLAAGAERDPSGRLAALRRLLEAADGTRVPAAGDETVAPRAVALVRAGLAFAAARGAGADAERALAAALGAGGAELVAVLRAVWTAGATSP
jgi:CheY-like chemotaxis protein